MHSTATVATWLERILGHEGGFTLNRDDPGNWTGGKVGAGTLLGTKWGIAANTYAHLDIPNLTADDAAELYIKDYLLPLGADRYGRALAFQMLDTAINAGVPRANRLLQEAIGVKVDGQVGPVTLAAIAAYGDAAAATDLLAVRLEHLAGLKTWPTFGRGWARRIAKNQRYIRRDAQL